MAFMCDAHHKLMTIELAKEVRKEAIASIERYFRENMDEPIGNVAAGALLGFLLEEIGPSIYNQAVAMWRGTSISRPGRPASILT